MVGKLLTALRETGAGQLAEPICRKCGRQPRSLTFAEREHSAEREMLAGTPLRFSVAALYPGGRSA